jgi:hypothetical protein
MSTQVYDGSREMRARIEVLVVEGVTLLCPRCHAELIVALDLESIQKHKVHPGIYCSQSPRHFFEMHELKRDPDNSAEACKDSR